MFEISFRSFALEKDLQIAKRVGIKVIELVWLDDPNSRDRRDEILALTEKYDIGISAITSITENTLSAFQSDLDFAAITGAKVLAPHPDAIAWDDRRAVEAFKALWQPACEYAAKKGISLCVHSCGLDPVSWDIMLMAVPGLGLKYDPSFSAQAGRSYADEISKYGGYIKHVHIKDEVPLGRTTNFESGILPYRYVPAGMGGNIHWGTVIALLYEAGYTGDFAIETHSAYWVDNLERNLVLSKRHLEQFIA